MMGKGADNATGVSDHANRMEGIFGRTTKFQAFAFLIVVCKL